MTTDHTVRSFSEELKALVATVQQMGRLAESQLDEAMMCLLEGDNSRAERVVRQDQEIDKLHYDVYSGVQEILVRRQPLAQDLREVVSCGRIAADIERIGDHAKNIARRTAMMQAVPPTGVTGGLAQLASTVGSSLRQVMTAFCERDAQAALVIWRQDKKSDEMFDSLFEQILGVMKSDSSSLRTCTHLMFIAKGLERIGDHATNIAEDVVYSVTGSLVTADRETL